jgi:hypothetical protein
MWVLLSYKPLKFYFIKLGTDFLQQPSYLLGETSLLLFASIYLQNSILLTFSVLAPLGYSYNYEKVHFV